MQDKPLDRFAGEAQRFRPFGHSCKHYLFIIMQTSIHMLQCDARAQLV